MGPSSILGQSAGNSVTSEQKKNVTMATYEIAGVTDLFNIITETCFEKCISKITDGELQVGETTCDDRCVIKYMATQNRVAEILNKYFAAQQAAVDQGMANDQH